MQETIAAISTPFGEGAIAVIRLSGAQSIAIADAVFRSKRRAAELPSRVQQYGEIADESGMLDEVLLTVFHAPSSYTGEEMVEIACHGGILVTRRLLGLLLERGASAAGPGEFTQRAFLNGKMDLTQAEAVMDLIRAQTDLGLRAATEQLEGRLGERIREIRDVLLDLLAHVEAYIDFPEEDIKPDVGMALQARLDEVRERIAALLRTADQGRVLREGLRTVICGAPNVGKSSLLNRLLGYERAIVSEIPGTTRDTIEEVVNLRGIPVRLIDTAGIRESQDAIEQQGIARTLQHLERADLVLQVVDASQPHAQKGWIGRSAHEQEAPLRILILNKIDLGEHPSWSGCDGIRISCLESADTHGIEPLADAIFEQAMGRGAKMGDFAVAINARHQACLKTADRYAQAACQAFVDGLSAEFISIELRSALDAVGDVVGRVETEDLIGKIFSTFCLGK